MKYRILLISILICFLFVANNLKAAITLPAYLSDNMVLQQLSDNKIRGYANKKANVNLTTSWNEKIYSAQSDEKGYFEITITTPTYGGPYEIKISDGDTPLTLQNILIGDVWLCSGQSNMEMPVKGYRGQPVNNSQQAIVQARANSGLRLFTVKREYSTSLQDDVHGSWSKSDSDAVAEFSAAAYFFGDLLESKLNIPIGLIHSSWGASKIEAWMDKETLSKFSEIDLSVLSNKEFGYPNGTPTLLYNAMIYPLRGLAIKGVIWYQGESNSSQPELYAQLFEAWVNQWRTFFANPDMPVYYTEIAPYQSANKDEINLPLFRESQLKSMQQLSNVGMAFTTDIGNEKFIHAPEKQKVGERLAYWALAKTYGIKGISYCGPVFKSFKRNGNQTEIQFDHAEIGLNPENAEVKGFEIAGDDGVFVEANAEIINGSSTVKVWSKVIPDPAEIRYCFRNYKEGNLQNNASLPAISFRVKVK